MSPRNVEQSLKERAEKAEAEVARLRRKLDPPTTEPGTVKLRHPMLERTITSTEQQARVLRRSGWVDADKPRIPDPPSPTGDSGDPPPQKQAAKQKSPTEEGGIGRG